MKLSIYVPDRLWAKAAARHPGAGPSRLVQMALWRLVERSRPRFAAPPIAPVTLSDRRSRLAELAQREYDTGYESGLALCEGLAWPELERIAAGGWSLAGLPVPTDGRPSTHAGMSGLRDALRDAWLGVMQAAAGATADRIAEPTAAEDSTAPTA